MTKNQNPKISKKGEVGHNLWMNMTMWITVFEK